MEAREERRSVVASGKTVDDAIDNGLKMLGVRRDQVDVEIISPGSRGVLGFGAEHARVRLLVKAPPQPAAPPAKARAPLARTGEPAPRPAPTKVPEQPARAGEPAPMPEPSAAREPKSVTRPPAEREEVEPTPGQAGQEILSELLRLMGIQATLELRVEEDLAEEDQPAPEVLNITGDDLGILIGRRGETLKALQYLVRLMVSHRVKHWTNLVVDVEQYRVRRRRALESLAQRVAEEVVRTGRTQALEPMPAYDRRLVHIALRNHPRVMTKSVGEGERRKVTIVPKH